MWFLRAERQSESTQSLHDQKGGPYGFGVVPFTLSHFLCLHLICERVSGCKSEWFLKKKVDGHDDPIFLFLFILNNRLARLPRLASKGCRTCIHDQDYGP